MKGHFVTTFHDWSKANRTENVLRHGPEQDLKRRRFGRYDQLALADELVAEETSEDEQLSQPDAATDEMLSNIARQDDEDRLARRVAEQQNPDSVLLMRLSPHALDREIVRLEARIRSHSETRNRLRKEAYELSPHSLDMIGSPRKGLS